MFNLVTVKYIQTEINEDYFFCRQILEIILIMEIDYHLVW